MSTKNALTDKQLRFAHEYTVDQNASAAALRAGYKNRNEGDRALRRPHVRAVVDQLLQEQQARTGITADRVINELARVAFANLGDYFNLANPLPTVDLTNATKDQLAAIESIEVDEHETQFGGRTKVRIRLHDKLRALEMLAKHFRIFEDAAEDQDATNALKAFVDALKA